MSKQLRIVLDADKLTPEDASLVLGELGEFLDYNVPAFEVSTFKPLYFGGERVGQWRVVEVD